MQKLSAAQEALQITSALTPMNNPSTHTITRGPFPQTEVIPQPLTVHESVSPLAAELLMKAAEILAKTPERYYQGECTNECGAPCCIIGHMLWLVGAQDLLSSSKAALDSIGLSNIQRDRIYHTFYWPMKHTRNPSPQEGIARIEHFLRTGE